MTRDEALVALDELNCMIPNSFMTEQMFNMYKAVQTYILNSIPTPTVEVVEVDGKWARVEVNGKFISITDYMPEQMQHAANLRAALGIEVQP